jgi:hypothetical protein
MPLILQKQILEPVAGWGRKGGTRGTRRASCFFYFRHFKVILLISTPGSRLHQGSDVATSRQPGGEACKPRAGLLARVQRREEPGVLGADIPASTLLFGREQGGRGRPCPCQRWAAGTCRPPPRRPRLTQKRRRRRETCSRRRRARCTHRSRTSSRSRPCSAACWRARCCDSAASTARRAG